MERRTDILIEALEVFINQVIYLRGVYPSQIFKKQIHYNTPIFICIYPQLNVYLRNVLRAARHLMQNGNLECVEVVLYRHEAEIIERYNFGYNLENCSDVNALLDEDTSTIDDKHLLEFEEALRNFLYKLAERLKPLKQLSNDTKFKVVLHTNQTAFVNLCEDSHYQEFPWLHDSPASDLPSSEIALLPLVGMEPIGLKCNAIIYNT